MQAYAFGRAYDVASVQAAAKERGMTVTVVKSAERAWHDPEVVFVKETLAKQSKEVRADAIVPAYQKGRVSHVNGVDLDELEGQMTTWEPGMGKSPNNMDALVYAIAELLGLTVQRKDYAKGYEGLEKAAAAIVANPAASGDLAVALGMGCGDIGNTL